MFVLSGLAGILLGVLLLVQPGEGALALVFTIGFLAIVWGVITIIGSVRLRRLAAEIESRSSLP
ncbi:hypothetical protein GCM10029992_56150 [Glycomyces albus]